MGSGASNQVRSKSERTTKVENLCSPSLSQLSDNQNHSRFKSSTKEFTLFTANRSVANSQSDIVTHLNQKPCINRKSQLRIEPPQPLYGHRNSVGDTEVTVDKVSTQELHRKIHELELALAVSDSQRLDLQDQLQALEERASKKTDKNAPTPPDTSRALYETLNAKDQHIKQLETELKNAQTDFQKKTNKLKKHIRALTKQIFELRHEALISQMELKTQPFESSENQKSKTTSSGEIKEISVLRPESSIGHTKIIIELSSQISEQGEQIASLKTEVSEKNQRIEHLEAVVREMRKTSAVNPTPLCSEHFNRDIINTEIITSTVDEKYRNYFSHPTQKSHFQSADVMSAYTNNDNGPLADSHLRSRFRCQTTSLSDSDSDWDEGLCLSQGNRHSAPVCSRNKSHKSDLSIHQTSSIRGKPEGNLQTGDNYLSNSLAVLNTAASNNIFEAKEQL
ncbi:unnamed protein product [Candidula unifasciata]|uniref:Uncharacterized protein n=1 Tax=Candidula unifasciata TaxID=100452 RepID=A0A8S3YLY0_9EUPU|nr:unnamed protein product [Candidula unifasciata]